MGRKDHGKRGGGKGSHRASELAVASSSQLTRARSYGSPWWVNPSDLSTPLGSWYGLGASEAAAVGLSALWRGMTLICDALTSRWARWIEYEGNEPIELSRLAIRPAARLTRRRWVWRVAASEILYNRCPLWMVGGLDDEGVPWSLLPLPPDSVQPDGPIDELMITPPARWRIGRTVVSAEELTWVYRAELPSVPPHLASLLELARRVFQQAIAADVAAARYWTRGGQPLDVITTEQVVTGPQATEIEDRWLDKRATGRPVVIGRGGKAEPYGADPTTATAVEARRELVADVGRLIGVGPHLLNAPAGDSMTYSTTEAEGRHLVRYTLSGYADPIADTISDLLPGDNETGRRIEIDLEALERPGMLERFQSHAIGLERGFLNLAEIRTDERRPPLPEPADSGPTSPAPGRADELEGEPVSVGAGPDPVAPGAL